VKVTTSECGDLQTWSAGQHIVAIAGRESAGTVKNACGRQPASASPIDFHPEAHRANSPGPASAMRIALPRASTSPPPPGARQKVSTESSGVSGITPGGSVSETLVSLEHGACRSSSIACATISRKGAREGRSRVGIDDRSAAGILGVP
jgi:hypothetical protein